MNPDRVNQMIYTPSPQDQGDGSSGLDLHHKLQTMWLCCQSPRRAPSTRPGAKERRLKRSSLVTSLSPERQERSRFQLDRFPAGGGLWAAGRRFGDPGISSPASSAARAALHGLFPQTLSFAEENKLQIKIQRSLNSRAFRLFVNILGNGRVQLVFVVNLEIPTSPPTRCLLLSSRQSAGLISCLHRHSMPLATTLPPLP